NRYVESVVNHDLEDQLFIARKENRGFIFNINVTLNNGFSSEFWKNKYDKANNSIRLSKEAISGLSKIRILDRQNEALIFAKTIYDSVMTIKDVVQNVKSQSYFEAIRSAKEGIDGFIDNYKEIEEAKFRKQETESLEIYMNGLVRRANRIIRTVEPILSFMKANAEEADRFFALLERIQAVKQKVFSGAVQKMVYGDHRYTWNYEPFMREANDLVARTQTQEFSKKNIESKFAEINDRARASWQEVCENVTDSEDEDQTQMMMEANIKQWTDYEIISRKILNDVLAHFRKVEEKPDDKKSSGVSLFAGSEDLTADPLADKPKKVKLFAGADVGKSEQEDDDFISGKNKVSLFAGHEIDSDKGKKDPSEHKFENDRLEKSVKQKTEIDTKSSRSFGEIYNTGTGDTSTHIGGNYLSIPISELAENDVIQVEVSSGNMNFLHIHLRNSRGVWYSIYNGKNTLFRIGNLLANVDWSAFTHLIFSVNSQHTKNLPLACRANLILHKGENPSASIEKRLAEMWRKGTGEIPNEYVLARPGLQYKGQIQSSEKTVAKHTTSNGKLSVNTSGSNKNQSQSSVVGSTDTQSSEDRLTLANKVNAIIHRADADFNKKYWEEKSITKTSQKPENPKASTLAIVREAIKIADAANKPADQIFLYDIIARKLIDFSGRVFGYVGKAEFFNEAVAVVNKTGSIIGRASQDKTIVSFLYSDHGSMWQALGHVALVGNHSYNKNDCYKQEISAYEKALQFYPQNHKALKALNK
ncbi:MAG: hypothetical protein ACOYXC_13930, partial [Candidatus Rifleibacteriota bacterium]